jgi:hypothetical protein
MGRVVESQQGTCETHGTVDAIREIPPIIFPANVVQRSLAKRKRFVCPECEEPVDAA